MRAERHANTDLACAARDRVCLYAIDAHDSEQQRNSTKDSEEQCAKMHDPEADAFFGKIEKWRDAQDRQVRIDATQCLAHGRNERGDSIPTFRGETHVQVNIATVALREW